MKWSKKKVDNANPEEQQPAETEAASTAAETSPAAPDPAITPEPTPAEPTPDLAPPPPDPRDEDIAALKDRLLRLQADFDNFRKRTVRDRDDQIRRASERILKDFLPVIDHFELGIQSAHKHHVKSAVIEGFEGIRKQFHLALEKAGVTPIETKDQTFDPHLHESVTQVHSEEHPENAIIQETRRGYMLGNYVLRATQVIVSIGPAPAPASQAEAEPTADSAPPPELEK